MVELIEGGYYRDVNGQKVGPMVRYSTAVGDPYNWKPVNHSGWWDANGKHDSGIADLVDEWVESAPCEGKAHPQKGPTRTVTRLEVVPGMYSGVYVEKVKSGCVYLAMGDTIGPTPHDADELEAAAAVLIELAKAVRDGQ